MLMPSKLINNENSQNTNLQLTSITRHVTNKDTFGFLFGYRLINAQSNGKMLLLRISIN